MVKEGQPLVRIDPAPYRAQLAAATANLEQAEAAAKNASVTAAAQPRARPSSSWYRACSSTTPRRWSAPPPRRCPPRRRRSRRHASTWDTPTSRRPIAGRAGQMRVLEGALVGQGEATLLTTVEQLDPIYVFFDQPASDFERLQRAQAAGQVTISQGNLAEVQRHPRGRHRVPARRNARLLRLQRERVHRLGGLPRHGSQSRTARCCRACTSCAAEGGRAQQGFRSAAARRAARRPGSVRAGRWPRTARSRRERVEIVGAVGANWAVTSGLADGDQVIVSGMQRAAPGMKVVPKPVDAAPGAAEAPAKAAQNGQTGS